MRSTTGMISKPIRIILMTISFLLGFVLLSTYLLGQVVYVLQSEHLDDYVNAWGITFVMFALIIVLTNIQSLIFHIKILMYTGKGLNPELLDDMIPNKTDVVWLRKMPSPFLRNSNMLFAIIFLANSLLMLFHGLFIMAGAEFSFFFISLCIISTICGMTLIFDAMKLKKAKLLSK